MPVKLANDQYHILCVDDDANITTILQRILQRENYQTSIATEPRSAQKILEQEEIDILLLDVNMPGQTGLDFCRSLRQNPRYQLLPIIFITSIDKDSGLETAIAHGGDDFLSKPIDKKEILAKIRAFVRIKTLQDTIQSQKTHYEREMQTARKVQQLLIPEKIFTWNQIEIHQFLQPFIQIGGDVVDSWVEKEKLHLVIADSSGHGPSAALLGAMFKMQLHLLPKEADLLQRVNLLRKNLIGAIPEYYSITFFYAMIDSEYNMEYINGGNPRPFVHYPDGKITELLGKSPLIIDLPMQPANIVHQEQLQKGCSLLLFTDGANEASNAQGKMLDTSGLIEIFKNSITTHKQDVIKDIMMGIETYCGDGNPPQDDIAFILVRICE